MTGLAKLGTCEPASPVLTGRPETRSRHASRRQRFSPIKGQGQNRRRSWPSRAEGHNAPSPVSRPCRPLRLSDRRYATDRDLTREMPLVVPRDQRNHFLPPVMMTVFRRAVAGGVSDSNPGTLNTDYTIWRYLSTLAGNGVAFSSGGSFAWMDRIIGISRCERFLDSDFRRNDREVRPIRLQRCLETARRRTRGHMRTRFVIARSERRGDPVAERGSLAMTRLPRWARSDCSELGTGEPIGT